MREMAKERNISLLELSELAEKDSKIDKELDEWVQSKIKSKQLGSWSHAIEWGLTLLREKLE